MVRRILAGVMAVVLLAGCTDTLVPDLNNPNEAEVSQNPTRAEIQSLANGVLIGSRDSYGQLIMDAEIIGRDAYNLDNADPRWVGELLINLDAGGFGGRHWLPRYRNVRSANLLMVAAERSEFITDAERSATLGFAKTIKALDLLWVYESRDTLGLVVEVGESARDLQPILCAAPALSAIAALLDEAEDDLAAAGSTFPFSLSSGFDGFDTPSSFAEFNRALRAKVAIYQRDYATALTALGESFLDTSAPLDVGVYHVYSLASGDAPNPLYQDTATTNFRVHPSVATDAPRDTLLGGTIVLDQRFLDKVAVSSPKTYQNVGSNLIFTVYEGLESPIPIITNEELILLRAQAYYGAGQTAQAAQDVNFIRQNAGGLSAKTYASDAALLDELLRQKRYSLLWESPSRWVDARYYGRLASLPKDQTEHNVHPVFPIPRNEFDARGGDIACSAT